MVRKTIWTILWSSSSATYRVEFPAFSPLSCFGCGSSCRAHKANSQIKSDFSGIIRFFIFRSGDTCEIYAGACYAAADGEESYQYIMSEEASRKRFLCLQGRKQRFNSRFLQKSLCYLWLCAGILFFAVKTYIGTFFAYTV